MDLLRRRFIIIIMFIQIEIEIIVYKKFISMIIMITIIVQIIENQSNEIF